LTLALAIEPETTAQSTLVHGPSSPLVQILRACARIAPSEATVLLTGETGTGKEVVARHLHEKSSRAKKPFVPVNCGAIPEALLESELFGHVRGAFTGAVGARRGRVAMAEGGTLFLDEVGELPLALQVKLLRLLQERTFEPVGSSESLTASFRLIAATNRNLAAEVEAGRFRRDLYYRLMVCPIELPALRDRPGDISRLFHYFWDLRGETRPVEPAVIHALEGHAWPGNVRELENLVERLSVCCEGPTIRLGDLPADFRPTAPMPFFEAPPRAPTVVVDPRPTPVPPRELMTPPAMLVPAPAAPTSVDAVLPLPAFTHPTFPIDLPALLRQCEDMYIAAALEQAHGNKKGAADMLGLQRTTLVEKLRRRNRDASVL
jgi:sigma-54 specific flagellar transcriptional regulator A